jgi:hypothetical protein
MSKPYSPEEAREAHTATIPDVVFEAFNAEIVRNLDKGGYAKVLQKDVVARIVNAGIPRKELFDRHWLNVERFYEQQGWKVDYDRPGYDETYDAFFEFQRRR